jgi:hypothetical protein
MWKRVGTVGDEGSVEGVKGDEPLAIAQGSEVTAAPLGNSYGQLTTTRASGWLLMMACEEKVGSGVEREL